MLEGLLRDTRQDRKGQVVSPNKGQVREGAQEGGHYEEKGSRGGEGTKAAAAKTGRRQEIQRKVEISASG